MQPTLSTHLSTISCVRHLRIDCSFGQQHLDGRSSGHNLRFHHVQTPHVDRFQSNLNEEKRYGCVSTRVCWTTESVVRMTARIATPLASHSSPGSDTTSHDETDIGVAAIYRER